MDQLTNQIKSDEARKSHISEPLAFNTFHTNNSLEQGSSSVEINGGFLHSELLLNSIITMSSSTNEKRTAIAHWRKEYENSASDIRILDDFESNYSDIRALYWYTRDSFLYRILNKAFRVQNIDVLYLMRFFIRDIRNQLVKLQAVATVSVTRVYRGQMMSKEELKNLKVNELLSMNSFFSTTLDRTYASFLLPDEGVQDDLIAILFEIDISQVYKEQNRLLISRRRARFRVSLKFCSWPVIFFVSLRFS